MVTTELYLKDFLFSCPLPAMKVTEQEMFKILSSSVKVEFRRLEILGCVNSPSGVETFVRYPELLGKTLSKVWIRKSLLDEISDKQLLALQYVLTLDESDPMAFDEYGPKELFVLNVSEDGTWAYPLPSLQSVGITLEK